MSRNFWDPSEGLQGLFDIWSFRKLEALVSAGLGGGSLIYANVFIRKDEHWFNRTLPDGTEERWPVSRMELEPHYDAVERIITPVPYPYGAAPYDGTPKTRAYQEAAAEVGLDWSLPKLAVTFGSDPDRPVPGEPIGDTTANVHGQRRYSCRLVG